MDKKTRKAISQNKWRAKNKEKIAELQKRWRIKNKEHIAKYNKKYRKLKGKEFLERHREEYRYKNYARRKLANAVKDGKIKRGNCVVCSLKKTEGHHPDYSKPLYVIWLCKKHHVDVHFNKLVLA